MGSQLYDYRHVHAHNFFLTCPKSTICPIFTQEFCVVFYNFQRNAHECLPQETGNCEILLKHNVAPQDILWRQGQCVKIVNQKRSIIVIFVITYFPHILLLDYTVCMEHFFSVEAFCAPRRPWLMRTRVTN